MRRWSGLWGGMQGSTKGLAGCRRHVVLEPEWRLRAVGALLSATDPRAVLISGGCFAVGSTLYILSMQLASVAAVSCVSATSGLFAALLARVWLDERAGPGFYAAMALAIAGVAVIAFSESAASFNGLAVFLVISLSVGLVPIPGSQVAMLLFMGAIQLALPLVLFMRGARHVAAAQMVLLAITINTLIGRMVRDMRAA